MEKALSLSSKFLVQLHWRRGVVFVFVLLALFGVWDQWREKEIALLIGEPWEDMRQRSSAGINSAIPGHFWGRLPESDAWLCFIDPQYGFATPLDSKLFIRFRSGSVGSISVFNISVLGGHIEYPKQTGKICPGNVGMELVRMLRSQSGLLSPPRPQP